MGKALSSSLSFPVLKPSHGPCRLSQGHRTRGGQEAQRQERAGLVEDGGCGKKHKPGLKGPGTGHLAQVAKKRP